MKTLALVVPLAGLAIVLATLAVLACQTDPRIPVPRVVIVPFPAPKSLVVWWEYEQTTKDNAPFDFARPYKSPPFFPLAYYVGRESPENMIAERDGVAGKLRWGPQAINTPYEVVWRGAGEVHIRVPYGATESQLAKWEAEIQQCEGHAVTVRLSANPQSSNFPKS